MKIALTSVLLMLGLAALATPALADGYEHVRVRAHRHYHVYRIVLPPERHVIEVVYHAISPYFIINGTKFTAKTPACVGWTAGDRIKLIYGSWHGACVDAAFYNISRRRSCEMWCG